MSIHLRVIGALPAATAHPRRDPRVLLVGPYDPKGGEYTFLAPPLGVSRLSGVLSAAGICNQVFDPNCCDGLPHDALRQLLHSGQFDVVGFSTTGMTLEYDLALAHAARHARPEAMLVAGGMEATFDPETLFRLAPFDAIVLGEGERPLLEIVERLRIGNPIAGVKGTAFRHADGRVERIAQPALDRDALRDAIFAIPYETMPYAPYWDRLEARYRVGDLPVKAEREARLAEIRSVRLITLNYCPMGCTFCSSTNFLNAAQGGSRARIARLDDVECLEMIKRIVRSQPGVRTIIFQDDIFVFTQDQRILPLCAAIVTAKQRGELPRNLQFISTNRIDAMTPERLRAMRMAGFRVLGFGIESFSPGILKEFNKSQIHPFIEPMLSEALRLGITPFLDMILSSPRCATADIADSVRQAYRWIEAGCEVGIYPYVIPFSGAAMAADESLRPHTVYEEKRIDGCDVVWRQARKILPIDPAVRDAVLDIERVFDRRIAEIGGTDVHLPSRVRSLVWIAAAVPVLQRLGHHVPSAAAVDASLRSKLTVELRCAG